MPAGCQAPADPTAPTVARVSATSPQQFDTLWKATDETLRSFYLEPDRRDRSEGVIVSRPETSAAWFEIWRPQPNPAYFWWEANLSPVRRQATVTISAEPSVDAGIAVQVDRYRYSLEPRQVDNPAGAMRLYGDAAPTARGRMERPSETSQWVFLGRDAFMEQAILTDILKRFDAGLLPAAPAPTTQPAGSAG